MRVIFGKHAGDNFDYMWEKPTDVTVAIGDYAIVQCANDIALVKVTGTGTVVDEFKHGGKKINKKVIKIIKPEEILPPKEEQPW